MKEEFENIEKINKKLLDEEKSQELVRGERIPKGCCDSHKLPFPHNIKSVIDGAKMRDDALIVGKDGVYVGTFAEVKELDKDTLKQIAKGEITDYSFLDEDDSFVSQQKTVAQFCEDRGTPLEDAIKETVLKHEDNQVDSENEAIERVKENVMNKLDNEEVNYDNGAMSFTEAAHYHQEEDNNNDGFPALEELIEDVEFSQETDRLSEESMNTKLPTIEECEAEIETYPVSKKRQFIIAGAALVVGAGVAVSVLLPKLNNEKETVDGLVNALDGVMINFIDENAKVVELRAENAEKDSNIVSLNGKLEASLKVISFINNKNEVLEEEIKVANDNTAVVKNELCAQITVEQENHTETLNALNGLSIDYGELKKANDSLILVIKNKDSLLLDTKEILEIATSSNRNRRAYNKGKLELNQ